MNVVSRKPILEGWSSDQKYCITDEKGEHFLLRISSNTLSSVYWAIPYGETEVNKMLNQAEDVLTWFGGMTKAIPTWYSHETSVE